MVLKRTPKATDIAIGTRNWAWKLFSRIKGAKPTKVVIVVNIIGLNLFFPALITASFIVIPCFRFLLYLSSITIASLTKMPIKATTPHTLIIDNGGIGNREIHIDLKEKAYALGLNEATVMKQIRQGFFGEEAQRLILGRDEIKIWQKLLLSLFQVLYLIG